MSDAQSIASGKQRRMSFVPGVIIKRAE